MNPEVKSNSFKERLFDYGVKTAAVAAFAGIATASVFLANFLNDRAQDVYDDAAREAHAGLLEDLEPYYIITNNNDAGYFADRAEAEEAVELQFRLNEDDACDLAVSSERVKTKRAEGRAQLVFDGLDTEPDMWQIVESVRREDRFINDDGSISDEIPEPRNNSAIDTREVRSVLTADILTREDLEQIHNNRCTEPGLVIEL